MAKLLLLQGPNLNLLGRREPEIYGQLDLAGLHQQLQQVAMSLGQQLDCYQSNAEHALLDKIQQASQTGVDFIIINPAAYGHTSIALRDALLAVAIPFIEVHISNIFAREDFRRHTYLADIAQGVICGLGVLGYELALRAAHHYLSNK